MSDKSSITGDPIFFVTVLFFAIITTAMPAMLSQPRFLPILQTVCLTVFIAVSLRQRNVRGALTIMSIWLPIQFFIILFLTRLLPTQLDGAITDGFLHRGATTAWFFGGAELPNGLGAQPARIVVEFIATVVGALATAGTVGIWFLMRMLNQAAFGAGVLLSTLPNPSLGLLVIPYWSLFRIAGYAGLIVLCAMPLLTNNWSPRYYWQHYRKLVISSLILVLVGIVLELLLPGMLAQTR